MKQIIPLTKEQAVDAGWTYTAGQYVTQEEFAEYKTVTDSHIQSLEDDIIGARTDIVTLQTSLDNANDKIEALTQRVTDLENIIDVVEAKFPIQTGDIATDAITTDKIAPFAVTEVKLAKGSVTNSKIVDGAVMRNHLIPSIIDASKIENGAVINDKIAIEQITANKLNTAFLNSLVRFNVADNIVLRDGTKILATTQTNELTAETPTYTTHELIGMNKYTKNSEGNDLDPVEYPLGYFYASELGNMHVNTTINTADNLAVDTEHGREYVQYISNGGKNVLYGDLSQDGSEIKLTFGQLQISASRINSSEVGVLARTLDGSTVSLPIVRRLTPSQSNDTIFRDTKDVIGTSTVLDSFPIGSYKMAEYWVSYEGAKYYIIASSDEVGDPSIPTLEKAWLEVYDGFVNTLPDEP